MIKPVPRYMIIRSLISGCNTESIMLSGVGVSTNPPGGRDDLYHGALSYLDG